MLNPSNHTLYLFDIDGTLLSPGSVSRMTLDRIIRDVTGKSPVLDYKDVAGYTDPGIVKKALIKIGFHDSNLKVLIDQILTIYIQRLDTAFNQSNEPFVYEDGKRFLELVIAQGHAIGLMTGNMQATARIKLHRFGLEEYFPFGVFGDDVNSRMEMPAVAIKRAFDYYSHAYYFEDMVIVGDTANDAKAAFLCGAQSVIVCRKLQYRDAIIQAGATIVVSSLNELIPHT